MSRAARVGIIAVSVVIFCYAGLGHVLGRTPDEKAYKSLTVYGEGRTFELSVPSSDRNRFFKAPRRQ